MSPRKPVDERVASFLALLGEKIRSRSFTELEVQETLGWERSHFNQLKTGARGLRIEEVLQVLGVIGVEPKVFFAELYGPPPAAEEPRVELAEVTSVVDSIVNLLVENQVITAGELTRAVAARAGRPLLPGDGESTPKPGL